MKKFKKVTIEEIASITCDRCGLEAESDDYAFHEFISINHQCGYGSIHRDGNQLNIDLCQQCFADICGDTLVITNSTNEK